MKDIITVTKFTIKDMIQRKSFIISTIIILLLIVIGFNIPNIIESFNDDNFTDSILIIDKDNVFEGNLETLNKLDLGYEITIGNDTYEEIKEKINNEEIYSGLVIEKENSNIKMTYIVDNLIMSDGIPESLLNSLSSLYTNIQINKLGLSLEEIQMLNPNFQINLVQASEEEVNGNIFTMMLLSIVLFYAIYFCAYQVSSSITTEKTSKIIETLVTSTSPTTIVLGKTIGIGLVGLLQLILIIVTSLVSCKLFLEPEILNAIVDVSSLTISLGVITILYFILGYFAYALLYALTGSTVGKPEDIQSANTPVAIIVVICFYLSYFTMMNPTSELNVFASLFPLSSPFCMPFRYMMGLATIKDVIISAIILILAIILIAKITIKIYSNAILNYGSKMSIKDILKMSK